MRRTFVAFVMLIPLGFAPPRSRSQGVPDVKTPKAGALSDAARLEQATHRRQLETCRDGLLDPQARDEDRRRWADLLLSYDSPQARALVVELLEHTDRPEVQKTLCHAIRDQAHRSPERLDDALAQPILVILGASDEGLRAAAAQTLADFPGSNVPRRLGEIAANAEAPREKRLAAVDALAPNTHRRDVVAQLITLLDSDVPAISARAIAALEPASRGTFGSDLDRWRAWWSVRSHWSEEDWLAEQLEIYRQRSRRVADEYAAFQKSARQSATALAAQFHALQRELFRTLDKEQREARLVAWLDNPLSLTNQTALAIIKARIADEGKRPEGEVLTALLRLLKRASGETQRDVLQIVQTLNNDVVIDAVLGLLAREREPKNRYAVFAAIGQLDSPKAVPALIRELADEQAPPECVREAAIALGSIAGRAELKGSVNDAIEPLKRRYGALAENDQAMRAALVSAMAGLGNAAFTSELAQCLESDDPAVLQPALRGLRRIGDATKLARFRALTAHADPLVRLAAIDAVSHLGTEEADLETLLARLNPTNEPNAPVREAAWRGFLAYMDRRSIQERIKAADRLRDMPELEIQYLTKLADGDAASSSSPSDAETITEHLASVLSHQKKYGNAAVRWRQLFELRTTNDDPAALEAAIQWLDATLHMPTFDGLSEILIRLAPLTRNEPARSRIFEVVKHYLESPEFIGDAVRARALLAELRSTGPPDWSDVIDQSQAKLASEPPVSGPDH